MNKARRQLFKFLCALPIAGGLVASRATIFEEELDDQFVILDGWILKKSDLTEFLK